MKKILTAITLVALALLVVGTTLEAPAAERLPHFLQSVGFAGLFGLVVWIASSVSRSRKRTAVPVRTDENE